MVVNLSWNIILIFRHIYNSISSCPFSFSGISFYEFPFDLEYFKTNHYTVTDTLFDIIALAMSDISDTSVDYEDDDGRIHDDDGSQDDSDQLPNDQDHNDQDQESSNDDEVDAVAVDTAPKG